MNEQKIINREDIIASMRQLKLLGMVHVYDEIIDQNIKQKTNAGTVIYQLMQSEIKNRERKSIQNRMRVARFPEDKGLHDFVFTDTPVNSEQIFNLHSGEFIKNGRNIILVGGTGTGKTHIVG